MTYKHYRWTAKEIAEAIRTLTGKEIKPQSILDHRNGKRKKPETLNLIQDAITYLEANR